MSNFQKYLLWFYSSSENEIGAINKLIIEDVAIIKVFYDINDAFKYYCILQKYKLYEEVEIKKPIIFIFIVNIRSIV